MEMKYMHSDNKIYIITYDFTNNKKRNKICKLLEDYGVRLQKSVFQCKLSERQIYVLKSKLKMTLKKFVNESSYHDSLIIFEKIKSDNILYIENNNIVNNQSFQIY